MHAKFGSAGSVVMGPGKAELLEGIRDTGSITAAGQRMGMSYRRAWLLVEEMNHRFAGRLVDATTGGSGGGGAALTPLGDRVLAAYRSVERQAAAAARGGLATIHGALRSATPGRSVAHDGR